MKHKHIQPTELETGFIFVHGTGSKGNAISVVADRLHILFDAGVQPEQVIATAGVPDILLVSHLHGDHAAFLNDYTALGVLAVAPSGPDFGILKSDTEITHMIQTVVGMLSVRSVRMMHNVECYAYVVNAQKIGRIVYITDTGSVPEMVGRIDYIFIEGNYLESDLHALRFNHPEHYSHVVNYHLSIDAAADFVEKHPEAKQVLFTHLGSGADVERVRGELERRLPKQNWQIATKNLKTKLL